MTVRARIFWGVVTGLAVFVFARILVPLIVGPTAATPLWIPSGVAAIGVLAVGPVVLPFVFLGVLAAGLTVAPAGMAFGMALIGTIAPGLLWAIIRRTRGPGFALRSVSDALVFGSAAIAATLVPALLGTGTSVILGANTASLVEGVSMWWLAESSAVLTIAPVALVWGGRAERARIWPDAHTAAASTILFSWYVYFHPLPLPLERVVPFMFLPLFMLIAFRGGRTVMAVTVAAVAMIASVGTVSGYGPFTSPVLSESLLALNLVITVFAFSSLALALLFEERARLSALAEQARLGLEARVAERTAALSLANESLVQQIAERRRAEEALAERELSFRLLYERAPLAYQSLDVDGNFLDVNDAWLDLTGYRREEIIGTWFGDILEHGQAALFAERFVGFKASGSVNGVPFNVRCKDGSVRQVAVYGRIAHSEDGSVRRTHCILQDVTRMNAEVEALRASREHFASLFENSHTIMLLLDPQTGRFVDVNAAACGFLGYDHDTLLGMTVMDLNDAEPAEMLALLGSIAQGDGGVGQDRQRLASGEWRDVEIHSGPVEVNGVRLVFATLQDVSDRVAAEREVAEHRARLSELVRERTADLERAYAELEAASAAKDQFLANMSHEFRTPLNSIIGFSDMLLSGLVGPMDVEQERQVGMINNSGKHLLELVNDVLDLARIESGNVRVEPEEFELAPLLESVVESLRPAAEIKGLALRVEQRTPATTISSDRRKVRQVLLNLLGNAVKFTDVGEVVLRVECDGRESITFEVADTGVGIPAEEIKRVFKEFHQVAPPDEAKPSGTGLGLAISLRLARILGGDLVVESAPGQGSVFTFTLPAVVRCSQGDRVVPGA